MDAGESASSAGNKGKAVQIAGCNATRGWPFSLSLPPNGSHLQQTLDSSPAQRRTVTETPTDDYYLLQVDNNVLRFPAPFRPLLTQAFRLGAAARASRLCDPPKAGWFEILKVNPGVRESLQLASNTRLAASVRPKEEDTWCSVTSIPWVKRNFRKGWGVRSLFRGKAEKTRETERDLQLPTLSFAQLFLQEAFGTWGRSLEEDLSKCGQDPLPLSLPVSRLSFLASFPGKSGNFHHVITGSIPSLSI